MASLARAILRLLAVAEALNVSVQFLLDVSLLNMVNTADKEHGLN